MSTEGGLKAIDEAHAQQREVLRQASIALHDRVVTLWEISPDADATCLFSSVPNPQQPDTELNLDLTLRQWGAPLIQQSRWVGCRMANGGRWCVAPVRLRPAAPPPRGVERRSRERMVLELAGLSLGALRDASTLDPRFRAQLLDDLANVADGIERAADYLRSIQDRPFGAPGTQLARFDVTPVVRSCVTLERPLARRRGVALKWHSSVDAVYLYGDAGALYQVLTNLIRNAVSASRERNSPVVVTLGQVGEALRLTVEDHGVGIAGEHLERIFEPGFTTQEFGSGSGTGLLVVRQITQDMFGGSVKVDSAVGRGSTFEITLPIPAQRTPRERRQV